MGGRGEAETDATELIAGPDDAGLRLDAFLAACGAFPSRAAAQRAIEGAKGLMKRMFITLEDPDLAYLVEGTPEFDTYIADMLWAQAYAFASRQKMMDAAQRSLFEVVGRGSVVKSVNCFAGETPVITRQGTRPIKTLAASGIKDFGKLLNQFAASAPIRRNVTIDDVGNTAAFLMSDLAGGISAEIVYVDGGFSQVALAGGE